MRQSRHSLLLAVSFLLGIMFVAPPMASTALAATEANSVLPVDYSPDLASNTEYCSYDKNVKMEKLYQALKLLPYKKTDAYLTNAIIITQPNDNFARSLTPTKTVLKKVDSTDIHEVTPAPEVVEAVNTPIELPVATTPSQAVTAAAPQVEYVATAATLNAEKLFGLVNAHRAQIGLAAFVQDGWVCSIAQSRAPELDNEIYGSSYMHAGFQARALPYWATENMISMRTEEEALQWWLNSAVHRSAIQGDYTHACVACAGRSCAMIFTSYVPKQ